MLWRFPPKGGGGGVTTSLSQSVFSLDGICQFGRHGTQPSHQAYPKVYDDEMRLSVQNLRAGQVKDKCR